MNNAAWYSRMWSFKALTLIVLSLYAALHPGCSQFVGSTAYVSPDGPVRLREAFQNNTVTKIVLKADYSIGNELDDTQPIPITR
jgi:hypothetical protein